jgi:DNA-binding response OmpR family regulator
MSKNEQLIMVVDDDPDILMVLEGNLKLAGFKVATFMTGKAALAAFSEISPELLILDLTLPDIDGIQLCRHLRELKLDFPVIMLTARDGLSDKVLGLECGADDYMVKPFAFLELRARIKTCLRRRNKVFAKPDSSPLRIGDLLLNRNERRVEVRGRVVELTKKEFNLLSLLIENRERIMTREEIRDALWGKRQLYSWSRAIDVHIRHLRLKIESNPDNPVIIKTVVGIGYRFMSEG